MRSDQGIEMNEQKTCKDCAPDIPESKCGIAEVVPESHVPVKLP